MDQSAIKNYVAKLIKRCGTSDPFSLAKELNIVVLNVPLGELKGFYMYLKKNRTIFINSDIEDIEQRRVVLAHEIGHALLHTKINCYFMQKNTFLNTSKYEIEANRFAAELLVSDEIIKSNPGMNDIQIAAIAGVVPELLKYKNLST